MPTDLHRSALAGMLLLALAACSDSGPSNQSKSGKERWAAIAPPPAPAATATPSTTLPAVEQPLVLRGNGLGEIAFGADVDRVIAFVNARLGQPTEDDRNAGCESSADRVVKWPGFYAVFYRGRWDGYRLRSTDVRAATEAGLKVGDTVADLRAAYPTAELMETTLGDEWVVEVGTEQFLTGLLTGQAPSDTLVDIAAGDSCVFR